MADNSLDDGNPIIPAAKPTQAQPGQDWHAGPAAPDNTTSGVLDQSSPAAPKEAHVNPAFPLTEPSPQPATGMDDDAFGDQPDGGSFK